MVGLNNKQKAKHLYFYYVCLNINNNSYWADRSWKSTILKTWLFSWINVRRSVSGGHCVSFLKVGRWLWRTCVSPPRQLVTWSTHEIRQTKSKPSFPSFHVCFLPLPWKDDALSAEASPSMIRWALNTIWIDNGWRTLLPNDGNAEDVVRRKEASVR